MANFLSSPILWGILAFIGWSGFVVCVCVIFAGAAREIRGAELDMRQRREERSKRFSQRDGLGGGHV